MTTLEEHDLRQKARRLTELRRRHDAHDRTLTEQEKAELEVGIDAEEMNKIIMAIRRDRRSAEPAKKVKAAAEKRAKSSTKIDIFAIGNVEDDVPNP